MVKPTPAVAVVSGSFSNVYSSIFIVSVHLSKWHGAEHGFSMLICHVLYLFWGCSVLMGFHVEHDLCSWASCLLLPDYRNISPLRLLFTLNRTFLFSLTLKSSLSGVCCLSSHSLNSILSTAFTLSNNQLTSYCCFSYHGVSLILNTVGVLCVSGLLCGELMEV